MLKPPSIWWLEKWRSAQSLYDLCGSRSTLSISTVIRQGIELLQSKKGISMKQHFHLFTTKLCNGAWPSSMGRQNTVPTSKLIQMEAILLSLANEEIVWWQIYNSKQGDHNVGTASRMSANGTSRRGERRRCELLGSNLGLWDSIVSSPSKVRAEPQPPVIFCIYTPWAIKNVPLLFFR